MRNLHRMIGPGAVLRRTDRHVSASLGDAVAMMDVDAGKYYVLDDVASFIWSRLEQPTSLEELVAELARRYDVAADRCEADVLPFLGDLEARGLVVVEA